MWDACLHLIRPYQTWGRTEKEATKAYLRDQGSVYEDAPMKHLEALRRATLADQLDVDTRLVYPDALEEAGQAEEAAYQRALARRAERSLRDRERYQALAVRLHARLAEIDPCTIPVVETNPWIVRWQQA